MTEALNILIFGSCVSRDVLNFDKENKYKLVNYFARSSIASLYSPIVMKNNLIESIDSSFQKRIVSYDLKKTFVEEIGLIDFDVLVLDLIDERFDLFIFKDGSICTLSSELVGTGFLQCHDGEVVKSGSDRHFVLWQQGWSSFINHLSILGVLNRVRIQKTFWCHIDEVGVYYDHDRINTANKYLEKLYLEMQEDLDSSQFIVPSKINILGAINHKWGRSPFHFINGYYEEVLELLAKSLPSEQTAKRQKAYDPYALHQPIIKYINVNRFLNTNVMEDGIHQIRIAENLYLDILLRDLFTLKNRNTTSEYILVGFNGAISNREGKRAPFFSGQGVASRLNLPIISISDPTLSMDENLPLAWYAGNEKCTELPRLISKILDVIALRLNKKLLLFGGSGGGFAALNQAAFLKTESIVLVWNPQTSIEKYVEKYVDQYDNIAFRDAKQIKLSKNTFKDYLFHDVCHKSIKENIQLLYMQNQSDWHMISHASPYIEDLLLMRYGDTTFISENGKEVFYFGLWGDSHAVPSSAIIDNVLKKLTQTSNVSLVGWALDAAINNIIEKAPKFAKLNSLDVKFPYLIQLQKEDDRVIVNCDIPIDNQIVVAYYLLKDGNKIETKWYSSEYECIFYNLPLEGVLEVMVFVKDIFDIKMSVRIPV